MKVNLKEFEVPENNPFEYDALSRKDLSVKLTQLILNLEQPCVLGIDSPWGSGKTTFVRMWRQHLENEGFNCLYFNAWETDFSEDPFVTMIGEIRDSIQGFHVKDEEKLKEGIDKVKRAAVVVVKKAVPLLVRLATSGLIQLDDKTEEHISHIAEEIAKEQLENYEERKRSIEDFRETLTDFVSTILEEENRKGPLVIFIDELDRCRPTYAIELLECAKHLFNVPGVVFIISVDKTQLNASIRSVYGSSFDSEGYLRRFIDLDFMLPEPVGEPFCSYLFSACGINDYFKKRESASRREDRDTIHDICSKLFPVLKLTLREQIQIVSRLMIILSIIPNNQLICPGELALMLIIRDRRPDQYKGFIKGEIDPNKIIEDLKKLPGGGKLFEEHIGQIIQAVLISSGLDVNVTSSLLEDYRRIAEDANEDEAKKEKAKLIIDYVSWCRIGPARQTHLPTTVSRIEFSEHFARIR